MSDQNPAGGRDKGTKPSAKNGSEVRDDHSMRSISLVDRPRERLVRLGASTLQTSELIAILLGSGTRGTNVVEVARNLLHLSHGLDGLLSFDVADLQKVRGIGKTKAIILRAAIELANRVKPKALNVGQRMQSSTAVVAYFQAKFAGLEKEQFHVVLLSPTKIVIDIEMISEGSLTETVVHPREVFRPAIVKRAHTIILIHNHPSGEARPSAADHALTRQLVQAGQTVGIRVIDHIIVGGENFYSMAEHNEIL